jgi:hypothetical protein
MFVLACMALHGLQDLLFKLGILHMCLVKACRDRGEGV